MMHRHSGLKTALGIFFTAIMLFPVYWMVNISFTAKGSIRSGDLFPKDFTLDNYARVLDIQLPNLATSIILALCCVILTLLIALPSAYALSLLRVRGSRVISFLLIVAQMIPAVVVTRWDSMRSITRSACLIRFPGWCLRIQQLPFRSRLCS